MRSIRTLPLVGLALSLAVLTGCAGAQPGVAVRVGDETITTSTVDEAAQDMCVALGDEFRGNGSVVPLGVIRQGVLQLLALGSQARQIAEEYDVTPGDVYQRDRAQRAQTAATFPEEVRENYLDVMTASALATDVLEQAGRAALIADGVTDPTVEQVEQRGTELFAQWPDANTIEVDPRYGLALVDGTLTPADTNVSVAVSEAAKKGLATDADTAYASSLPSNLRCG